MLSSDSIRVYEQSIESMALTQPGLDEHVSDEL